MANVGHVADEVEDFLVGHGEATGVAPKQAGMFDAFAVPDFRRLWFGSLVSNIGSWMQVIGSGWLVLQLTNSPFWLGAVSFAGAVPVLGLSLVAGVVADRVDRRRLIAATQVVAGLLALALAVLVSTGAANIGLIVGIAALNGTALAFNMPAWQAMVPDIVGRERLMNAVGLNSAAFNGAAVIGPAIAGVVVGVLGVAACFYLNALSYLAVLWALWRMRTVCAGGDCATTSIRDSPGAGLRFIARDRIVFVLFWMATIASLLARPYMQLMPVVARTALGGEAGTYGVLMAANGAGALAGALLTARLTRVPRKGLVLLGAMFALGGGLVAFALSRDLRASLALVAVAGGGATLYMGATNVLLLAPVASAVGSTPLVIGVGGAIVALNALVMGVGASALRHPQ